MGLHIKELRDCFSWGELKGTVVDVGGGSGHVSIALARVSISKAQSDRPLFSSISYMYVLLYSSF